MPESSPASGAARASAPLTAPAPTAAYGLAAADPLTQPLVDFLPRVVPGPPAVPGAPAGRVEPTWPCTRCDTRNPLGASVCAGCGGGFLDGLSDAGKPLLVLPVVGDLGAMSRGRRLGLAFALVVAVVVPIALLTLLLTQRPAPAPHVSPAPTVRSTTG